MASFLPQSICLLIEEFSKLPGVGPKSAQRLAMHLLHSPDGRLRALSDAVGDLKKGLQFCGNCWNIAEDSVYRICANGARDRRQICVVEEILDVVALEKTCEYKGVYHVLHGVLSPVDGIGPEQLKVQALVDRVRGIVGAGDAEASDSALRASAEETDGTCAIEVILATNSGLEGETTALYLMRLLQPFKLNVTRIARGLPVGGDLDYADELTLMRALQGRAAYC